MQSSQTHKACRSDLNSGTTSKGKQLTMYDVDLMARKICCAAGLVGSDGDGERSSLGEGKRVDAGRVTRVLDVNQVPR